MGKTSGNARPLIFPIVAVFLAALTLGYAAPPAQARVDSQISVPAQVLTSLAGVPNFGQVSPSLFRGGQPSDEGMHSLKNLGVNTIVNFRDDAAKEEEALARQLNINYVKVPWVAADNPTSAQIAAFLGLLRTNPKDKVFVHCKAGADRTGAMIAIYRMVVENWTPAKAVEEMHAYHYHHFLLGNLQKYVEAFPGRLPKDTVIQAALALAPVVAPVVTTLQQQQQ